MSLTTMTRRRSLSSRDVVERLPRHPAGERTVTDDRDDGAVGLAGLPEGAGDAVGPGQRRRRVRGLDDVVLGLAPLRVAGDAAPFAQLREVLPPGDELVHVRLVPGVEDERVVRRVEHPVHRERQLDDAEVRSEVPAGLRDLGDQEPPDLGGEVGHLRVGETLQVARRRDAAEQAHGRSFRGAVGPLYARPPADGTGGPWRRSPRASSRVVWSRQRPVLTSFRRASGARTAGCRRCGSSRPHPGCRCGRPRRTRPAACRRASARSASR